MHTVTVVNEIVLQTGAMIRALELTVSRHLC